MSGDNNDKRDNFAELSSLLGFNPSNNQAPTKDILTKVMDTIREERSKAAQAHAEKVLRQAMDLHQQAQAAQRRYEGERAKFNKELGKLVSTLKRMTAGQPEPEPEADGSQEGSG